MKMRRIEKRFVNSARHSARVAEHAEQLVRIADPQPGQQLLDFGCGNGTAPIHLVTTSGLEVTGVDIDPEQIQAAVAESANLATTRFLVADAIDLPFADGEFDLVYTNKATHHIREWQQALTEMTRVLKPGGHLLYTDFVARSAGASDTARTQPPRQRAPATGRATLGPVPQLHGRIPQAHSELTGRVPRPLDPVMATSDALEARFGALSVRRQGGFESASDVQSTGLGGPRDRTGAQTPRLAWPRRSSGRPGAAQPLIHSRPTSLPDFSLRSKALTLASVTSAIVRSASEVK